MKTYRVALSIGGPVFVTAERYDAVDGVVRFYRNGTVMAEYAKATVKDIMEVTPPPRDGGRSSDEKAK